MATAGEQQPLSQAGGNQTVVIYFTLLGCEGRAEPRYGINQFDFSHTQGSLLSVGSHPPSWLLRTRAIK